MSDKKIFADTSAWIVSFKKTGPQKLKDAMKDSIKKNRIVTAPFIILELLQGCRSREEFTSLKTRMESIEACSLKELDWEGIYNLGYTLRRKGLTIPTIDILISSICIQKGFTLLHHDRHFRMIAENSELDALDFLN